MGSLLNASKFAKDSSTNGFRDMALAALVYQARVVITAGTAPAIEIAFAKSVIRQAPQWQEAVSWAVASDPAVYVSAIMPTEPVIIAAVVTAWSTMAVLNL